YLDKVETFRSVVCNTKVGTRAPAHATSGGKIMLAFHDPDYVDAYCRDLPQMQRLTDRTVFSPDLLREQLAQARINGFAID
ncbi:30S ribosomal protein S16, partial [Dysosmobacter welbionis]